MQTLINTSEFYQTIDLIITPILLSNSETKHQYVNKAFLKQIGYSVEDIPDQNAWFNCVYPEADYRAEVKESWFNVVGAAQRKGDTHAHMVAKLFCADGSYKWFDVHENVYGNNKVVTFLDVDELVENYEELTDALKQKDILLSIIAHDVRSPLANIRQVVNEYKELDLSEAEITAIFSGMGTQIDYIFNIINSLLVRTSADRGSFIEKREKIVLKTFFSKYQDYYRERIEKQNIVFDFDLSNADKINFDPFILDVISRNLIDNAIKYSPDGGIITVSFNESKNLAELVIKDMGPGMSQIQSERILNNQGSRRLKNQITDSFGLGLIMAKEILEKHNGRLSIQSELGKGTSFVIQILKN